MSSHHDSSPGIGLPAVTPELCRRIESVIAHQQEVGMTALEQWPGNPEGVRVIEVPGAIAFLMKSAPTATHMNHICVTGPEWAYSSQALLEAYEVKALVPHIFVPEMYLHTVKHVLGHQYQFVVVREELRFYCLPLAHQPEFPAKATVNEVSDKAEMDLWLELFGEAFEGVIRKSNDKPTSGFNWDRWRHFHQAPGRRHFIAYYQGEPAAVAGLFTHDGISYLGPAATIDRFRGHGVHGALLRERMYQAHLAGAEIVVCGAEPGSISAHNQKREGFSLAYTRELIKLVCKADSQ